MALINEKGLQSAAAPNVYIRKVEISRSSAGVSKHGSSIDVTRLIGKTEQRIDKTLVYKQSNASDDTKANNDGIDIKIDLSIVTTKDPKNNKATWIDDHRAQEKIILKIVQSTNPDLTTKLLSGEYFHTKNAAVFENYNNLIDYEIYETSISSLQKGSADIIKQKNNLTANHILSLVNSVHFKVPTDPEHLTYFAVCEVEKTTSKSPLVAHSPVSVESIIKNSKTIDTSFKFFEEDGAEWVGPVHYHPTSGWMQGAFHVDFPHKSLTKQSVRNNKIVDHRVAEEADSFEINVRPSMSDQRRNYFSNIYLTRDMHGNAIFGFNFDHLGFMASNSRFGTLFDNSDIGIRNALLASSPIVDLTIFRERVRVFTGNNRLESTAEQVADFDFQEGPQPVICSFDVFGRLQKRSKYSFVGEEFNKTVELPPHNNVPTGYELTGMLEELKVQGSSGYRTFFGQDSQISRITDGKYQYSVKLQIKDGTIDFLQNKLQELRGASNEVEEYLLRASRPKNFNPYTRKFVDSFVKKEMNPVLYAVLNAAEIDNLQEAVESEAINRDLQGWAKAIIKYIEILNLLSNIDNDKKTRLIRATYAMLSPATASIDTISSFVELLKNLENKLTTLISKTSAERKEYRSSIQSEEAYPMLEVSSNFMEIYDSNVIKDTGFDYFGMQKEMVGILKISRSSFISRVESELRRYEKNLFSENEIKENFKFLTGDNIKSLLSDSTKGADIAPMRVDLAGKSVDLLSNNIDTLDYVSVSSVIQSLLTDPSSRSVSSTPDEDTLNILNLAGQGTSEKRIKGIQAIQQKTLSTLGLSVPDKAQVISKKNNNESNKISSEAFLGVNNKFTFSSEPTEDLTIRVFENDPQNIASVATRVLDMVSLSNNPKDLNFKKGMQDVSFDLDKKNNVFVKRILPSKRSTDSSKQQKDINDFIRNKMPHQQKLLTLNKTSVYDDPTAKATSNNDAKTDGFMYNFGMLRRVEYLSGFSLNNSTTHIKTPVWKKLTLQNLDKLEGTLLCRIIKVDEPILNIGDYESVEELPVYNEFFIIIGSGEENELTPLVGSPVNVGESIQSLLRGIEKTAAEEVVRMVSMDANSDSDQFSMTNIPINPTNSYRIISGLTKSKSTKKQVVGPPQQQANNALGVSVSRQAARTTTPTGGRGGSSGGYSGGGGSY
tara:strand:+ start:21861 stop:25370 length:3510 start_codon:yes stop_codon:yes gene_type:complete